VNTSTAHDTYADTLILKKQTAGSKHFTPNGAYYRLDGWNRRVNGEA